MSLNAFGGNKILLKTGQTTSSQPGDDADVDLGHTDSNSTLNNAVTSGIDISNRFRVGALHSSTVTISQFTGNGSDVTADTSASHNLVVNNWVYIDTDSVNIADGYYRVITTPTGTSFTIDLALSFATESVTGTLTEIDSFIDLLTGIEWTAHQAQYNSRTPNSTTQTWHEYNNIAHIFNNTYGSVTDATAGTSGLTVTVVNDGSSSPNDYEITTVSLSGATPAGLDGTYFTLNSTTTSYYAWFDLDDGSSDPTPGGTGIEVDIATGDSEAVMTTKLINTLNGVSGTPFDVDNDSIFRRAITCRVGDYTDWRLANFIELSSQMNFELDYSNVYPFVTYTGVSFWSSTSVYGSPSTQAYYVRIDNVSGGRTAMTTAYRMWFCRRSGSAEDIRSL